MKIEKISYEMIHEFGLTELLNVYKTDEERYPDDYGSMGAYIEGEWIWSSRLWYKDIDSANWILTVTGLERYLLCYKRRIYEIKISRDVEGNAYDGGVYSETFYLESVKALAPKESWDIVPERQLNRDWYSFKLKGNGYWGDIPYDKNPIEQSRLNSVKQYFKDALYDIEMTRLNGIIERTRKRGNVDFSIEITIEIKW